MSQLLELQIDIMYLMWIRAHEGSRPVSRLGVFKHESSSKNAKIGPVSQKRVDLSLKALRTRGHIADCDLNEDAEVLYEITERGTEWIEDWFMITKTGPNYWFNRRHNGPVIVDMKFSAWQSHNKLKANTQTDDSEGGSRASVFWTKWGAILTGFGILVAIIIAVAT